MMNEEHTENDIDNVFRKAIDPLLTEPSDGFWKKASEDIILRGNKAGDKKASRWKFIAFILAAGLLILGYVTYSLNNGLKHIEKQIAGNNTSHTPTLPVYSGSASSPALIHHSPIPTTTALQQPSRVQSHTTNINSSNIHNSPANTLLRQQTKAVQSGSSPALLATASNKSDIPNSQADNTAGNAVNQTSADNTGAINTIAAVVENTTPAKPDYVKQTLLPATGQDTNQYVAATAQTNGLQRRTDNISASGNTALKADSNKNLSKIGVSVFFSPDLMTNYRFTSNATNNVADVENAIKAEKAKFSYQAGVKVNYALSNRISFGLGAAYSSYTFSVSPCNLYAQKQPDGDIGFSLPTSSGMVQCPYYPNTWYGDTLKMNAKSTRRYLSVPLNATYRFLNNSKFDFYVGVGIEANIKIGEETVMNWQTQWQDKGVSDIPTAQGQQGMYWSYQAFIGGEYRVGKYFSFYLEPGINKSITPIDENVQVLSYPLLFTLTGGITYYFR